MTNKLEKRITKVVKYVIAGYENDVLDGYDLADRESIVKDCYANVMSDDDVTEFKFYGKDNTLNLIHKLIRESDIADKLIEMEAKQEVEQIIEDLRIEEENKETEEEKKAREKNESLQRADIMIGILETRNPEKKITQKYKIMYLFAYHFSPAIIAEHLGIKFQIVRKHTTDELKEGLRGFNKRDFSERQEILWNLQQKYTDEIK